MLNTTHVWKAQNTGIVEIQEKVSAGEIDPKSRPLCGVT
jgi:hypothetical protein